MFEDLKQQRGMTARERTRLFATVSLALVLGSVIFTTRSCARAAAPPNPTIPATEASREPARRSLDTAPFSALRAAGGVAADLDAAVLDHVLHEIRTGEIELATRDPKTPAQVDALDPKMAAGTPVEVVGKVRLLDSERHESAVVPGVDTLWAFALEGQDGAQVVVVHGGSSSAPQAGKPADAYRVGGVATDHLADGDLAAVRGVYLQKKDGGVVARVALGGSTAVVVGSEYRRLPTLVPSPPPESLSAIDWGEIEDRSIDESWSVEELAQYQVLAWAKARGRESIAADVRSGALPVRAYDRDAYRRWQADLDADRDGEPVPDPRTWTNEVRGKVFFLTGFVRHFNEEGWGTTPQNAYGIDHRWKVWLISDHHHHFGALPMHSPFPLTAFPGVTGKTNQRVKATAVFVKNHSWRPSADENRELTAPYFVLLDLEPFTAYRSSPFYENVFWYAGIGLLVFGALFYVVLIRGERKEATSMERHRIAIRQRARAHEAGKPPPPAAPDAPST
jgi:hypothetical protein